MIRVFDAELRPEDGLIHIVMEWGGVDLKRFLELEDKLSLGDVQMIWQHILEAVQVIHKERIVHSDLKPSNFICTNGRLKLIDFGIAKCVPSDTTHICRESSVGTISYMAPEAVRQGALKVGRSSDVWSLGIVLFQIVYGRVPFAHLDPMQRIFALTDPGMVISFPPEHRFDDHPSDVQEMLLDVLDKCLQRDPAMRPSIPELLEHPFLGASCHEADHPMLSPRTVAPETIESKRKDAQSGRGAENYGADVLRDGQLGEVPDAPQARAWTVRKRQAGAEAQQLDEVERPEPDPDRNWILNGDCKRQRTSRRISYGADTKADMLSKDAAKVDAVARPPPPLPRARDRPPVPSADSLRWGRAALRRVAPASKENVPPHGASKGGKLSADNVAMRRLQDRRRAVGDERTEEFTLTTKWIHPR